MGRPHELRIVRYEGEPSVYLFCCGDDGVELTDTWHETVEGAMRQAALELRVRADEWEDLTRA